MADPTPPSSRRFSEQEVALIIKRASELQEDDVPSESATGMSLIELEQIAREAGLDPALVRRAATDLDTRATDQPTSPLIGSPTSVRVERTVDGELSADEFEAIVLAIQSELGEVGTPATLGRTLQWTSSQMGRPHSSRSVQVSVTPRNGRTTIRIEEKLGALAGGLFGGLVGGLGGGMSGAAMGIGLGVFQSGLVTAGIMTGLLGGSYVLARAVFSRMSRSRGAQLQTLMSRLVEHVAATAAGAPAVSPPDERTRLERGS